MDTVTTVPTLPPAWELTTERFHAWCVEVDNAQLADGPDLAAWVTDDDEVAPPTWDAFIGQPAVVDELEVRIASAKARNGALPPVLLAGPAGAGKTTLARLIAAELGRPLVKIERPMSATAMAERITAAGPMPLVFIDEVHLWKSKAQHDLMDLTDTSSLVTAKGRVPLPGCSVVCATTNPEQLVGPLLSRFACEPRFQPYTDDDMELIVSGMAFRAGLDVEQVSREFQRVIAHASAGWPRAARHLVLAARDLHEAGRDITAGSVLAFTGTDTDGMTADHHLYLQVLRDSARGAIGVPTIAHLMGIAAGKVMLLERLLIDRGYIALSANGRQLTPAGHRRLSA